MGLLSFVFVLVLGWLAHMGYLYLKSHVTVTSTTDTEPEDEKRQVYPPGD